MRNCEHSTRLLTPRQHAWKWTPDTEPNPFILTKPRRRTWSAAGISGAAAGLVSLQTSHTHTPSDGFSWTPEDGIHVTKPPPREPADFDTYGPVTTMELDDESRFIRRHNRLRRNVWFAGSCITRTISHGSRCWMITLTYTTAEQVAAKQVAKAINAFRMWCRRHGIARTPYLWVAENQKRGVLHYHLLVWLPKGAPAPPKFDQMGWWPYGCTQRKPVKSATGYAMKYVSKWDYIACTFPKGLRLYGSGGLDLSDRRVRQWTNLPAWSRSQYGVGELRRVKGGILDIANDIILEPRYCPVVTRSTLRLVQVIDVIPKWYDGPYSRVECKRDARE